MTVTGYRHRCVRSSSDRLAGREGDFVGDGDDTAGGRNRRGRPDGGVHRHDSDVEGLPMRCFAVADVDGQFS
jgi:hypothetical protein